MCTMICKWTGGGGTWQLLKLGKTGRHKVEWTPEEASLLQDRPSLAVCCSVSLHLKGTWETQNHQKFCMRLVPVSFTINLQLHMFIIIETLNDHLKSLRDSKPPVLGTRGPRDRSHDVSVYETCACVIINLLSYMCIGLRGVHVLREALVI